ncbi:hypothetical protein JL721_8702 [Aureococcus anophagefferens]|nr:hypothetical protein JL721_8702 [Aureococcus anophagefferens]KAH8063355.1 hypothetical protein JL722_2523 [Aureococcus anophagefferens]
MARALVFAAALGSAASLDCLEAGFTASLRCSSCAKLESLVPDPELAADCGACCSEDLSASASYASAILEGQKPRLLMVDDDGEVAETVPIGGWNEDTVAEYLDDNLRGAAAEA